MNSLFCFGVNDAAQISEARDERVIAVELKKNHFNYIGNELFHPFRVMILIFLCIIIVLPISGLNSQSRRDDIIVA